MKTLAAVFLAALAAHAAGIALFCALHDDALEAHTPSNQSTWAYGKLFQRWDGQYYGGIARTGYKGSRHMAAFFPLYPWLMAPLHRLGVDSAVAGVIVSSLAFALACALAWHLSGRVRKRSGAWTVALLVCSPVLVFYTAVYSESLFLLMSLLTFWLAGEIPAEGEGPRAPGRPAAAALCAGFLLCLVRPQGFIVLAAICAAQLIAGEGRRRLHAAWWALPVAAAVVVLASANMRYGNKPLDWLNAQSAWSRRPTLPWVAVRDDVRHLLHGVKENPTGTAACGVRDDVLRLFDLASICVGLAVAWWWLSMRRWALGLFAAAGILVPLLTGNLLSIGRFTFASPAVALGLGAWLSARPLPARLAVPPALLGVGIYFGYRFTHWCFAG